MEPNRSTGHFRTHLTHALHAPHASRYLRPSCACRPLSLANLPTRLFAVLFAGFTAAATTTSHAADDSAYAPGWSTAHADAANTDYSPVPGSADVSFGWQRSFPGTINLGATSDTARVYITSSAAVGGQLHVMDKETGETRWAVTTLDRAAVASSALLDRDGRVFIADSQAMHAFTASGTKLWATPIVGFPLSAQFTRGGHLIFITHIGRIYVLRRDTGAPVVAPLELIPGATFNPSSDPRPCMQGTDKCPSANTLAVDLRTDRFYFTFWTPGKPAAGIRAMRLIDGAQPALEALWINDTIANGSAASPDLSADGARLYLTSNAGQLLALDTAMGQPIWTLDLGYAAGGSVSLSPEGIIMPAGGGDSPLLAVRDRGGSAEVLWRRDDINRGIPTQVAGGIAYATVAAASGDGTLDLLVIDTATGRELDRERLPGKPFFTVGTTIGQDGTVYIPSILGDLYAYRPAAARAADYDGPVPPPTDAFGRRGPYGVARQTFARSDQSGFRVTVFHPEGASGPWPTWFFAHGFGGSDATYYEDLLSHLASHGATVVFSPYPAELTNVAQNYTMLFNGFVEAAERFPHLIDTSRAAFAGHSYGGGAVPALALRALRERSWGSNGLALLLLAPWYSYSVSDADLASFPTSTLAVVQIYEDDLVNDHRMAIDIFGQLALPADNKDFLMLRSDRIDGYNYSASHRVPTGRKTPGADSAHNALDAWGVHRIAQALADATWRSDPTARAVALGHGSAAQTTMGVTSGGRPLRPMVASRTPVPLFPSSRYVQPFGSVLNPRRLKTAPAPAARPHLSNLSARARLAPENDVLMIGATIAGNRPKSLLMRAVGPSLTTFGINDPLPNPQLAIYRGATLDLSIDDWAEAIDAGAMTKATSEAGAFPLRDGTADAAMLASFAPGNLTAHARASSDTGGVTLLEIYDAEQDRSAYLSGLSGRAHLTATDDVLVAGFVVANGNLPLLIRAVGPTLASLGVPDAMQDPQLEIHRGGTVLATNDDWSADAAQRNALAAATRNAGLAPLADGSKDASVLMTLPPGAYTAVVRSRGAGGTALVEVYEVP